jgi:hypothetical protein
VAIDPRPATSQEVKLVKMLLPDGAFPDVELYRQQADHLLVTGQCQCGCPTVSFTVDSSKAPRARFHGTPLLPVEAEAGDGDDLVQLILFARHGWVESLELVYYSPEPPTEFPAPTQLRLVTLARGSDQDPS